MASLLALNGLRVSEALGADIDDLDFERGHRTLKIVRKGGKHVTVPLAPRTSRVLDLYIGERTKGPVFLGANGGRMDRYAADRTVKRLARRAGITKRISPHSLRQYGAPEPPFEWVVQRLLHSPGGSSPSVGPVSKVHGHHS